GKPAVVFDGAGVPVDDGVFGSKDAVGEGKVIGQTAAVPVKGAFVIEVGAILNGHIPAPVEGAAVDKQGGADKGEEAVVPGHGGASIHAENAVFEGEIAAKMEDCTGGHFDGGVGECGAGEDLVG